MAAKPSALKGCATCRQGFCRVGCRAGRGAAHEKVFHHLVERRLTARHFKADIEAFLHCKRAFHLFELLAGDIYGDHIGIWAARSRRRWSKLVMIRWCTHMSGGAGGHDPDGADSRAASLDAPLIDRGFAHIGRGERMRMVQPMPRSGKGGVSAALICSTKGLFRRACAFEPPREGEAKRVGEVHKAGHDGRGGAARDLAEHGVRHARKLCKRLKREVTPGAGGWQRAARRPQPRTTPIGN